MANHDNDGLSDALKLIGAGMVGAVIGGALVLMFAPKSGAAIRDDLKEAAQRASQVISEAGETVARTIHSIGDNKDKVTEAVEEVVEEAQEAAENDD